MQTAACDGIGHVAAQLAVGSPGVHIRAACPVAERIDLGMRIHFLEVLSPGVALAEDEPCAVQNVLPVIGISVIHTFGDLAEHFLLLGHRHSFEDTVVAAADSVHLIIGEVSVLRHFHIIRVQIPCDAMDNGLHFIPWNAYRCFRNDMADAVTDENLHGDPRIFIFSVRRIHQSAGDAVSHLVRVARIYFFKHSVILSAPAVSAP